MLTLWLHSSWLVCHWVWRADGKQGVCVCVCGGACSYIMQIHSHIVIRATELVLVLWINLLIGSGGIIKYWWEVILDENEKDLAATAAAAAPSFSICILRQEHVWRRTCLHIRGTPASQSQGRGDFELCAHTVALRRTLTRARTDRRSDSFNITKGYRCPQQPSLAAAF